MIYNYKTKGTCSRNILIDISEDGIINEVKFEGGCEGNAKGIGALAKGMKMEDVMKKCKNIDCAGRGTSCPDQLSKALEEILEKKLVRSGSNS